jgi:hypothetical protein
MSTTSNRLSSKSDTDSNQNHSNSRGRKSVLTVDQLFPSETNKSGTKGKRLDINTIFSGTATNPDVVIDMSHETLIQRRKQRKDDLHRQYLLEYKRCWDKINSADKDRLSETIFEVQTEIERFPEYSPIDCVELIQDKLRTDEYMDTMILDNNHSVYISWANIETNRDAYFADLESEENDTDTDRDNHNDSDNMRKEFDKKIFSITDTNITDTAENDTDVDH